MCLDIPPTMRYLLDFAEYPFELWINLDEDIGMQKEDVSYMESKKMGTSLCVLPPMISASYISQEAIRNEEEELAKDSANDLAQVLPLWIPLLVKKLGFMKITCELFPSLLLKIYLSILHLSPPCLLLQIGKMYF